MHLELNFLSAIDILTCSTAFMLGLLFITSKSENRKANLFLGLSLWSLVFEVFGSLSQSFSDDVEFMIHTSLFTIPFLLLYINQTINNHIKPWYYILFLPGIILNLILFIEFDDYIISYFEYVFNIGVLLYILSIIKTHSKRVNNFYSDLEYKTLQWIKIIVFVYLGFHFLWIIEDIIGYQNEDWIEYFAALSTVLTFFMVFWIGHNGFLQHETFKQKLFISVRENVKEEKQVSDINNDTEDQEAFEILKNQIIDQKLFTDPKLNLRTLSQFVNLNEKEVSRLINQCSASNFYQFINQFRVDEFKALLQSPKAKQLSILGLAEESGFNSKSTFYTAFKTLEGITPKQYEIQLKKSE
ncbi:AraC family transcriptional regulator [Aquimarina sp. 2201CG5-10]|uniref:helix-turn-helix domain-containing protein n=1 Tax=Aquimarina callyspongiae TaxID=3098150 RepID=UPI002AB591A8|nr:AraC family transcriptional regulator [Aquimarina sp. 2201CG5-10]MDY8135912.1 AraC family transcriptional regulator [Aquimarina sp. 2201CG5-10]